MPSHVLLASSIKSIKKIKKDDHAIELPFEGSDKVSPPPPLWTPNMDPHMDPSYGPPPPLKMVRHLLLRYCEIIVSSTYVNSYSNAKN